MFKSTNKNKYVFLILNVFLSLHSFAQTDIAGKWETQDIIGYSDVVEYSLLKKETSIYGRHATFSLDGTFSSNELIGCPNGCSVLTSGTYELVDNDHIHIIVENVRFFGLYCGMIRSDKKDIIKDLGIFYIHKDANLIRLIPSNGILQDDKDKMLYTEMLKTFDKNWKGYEYSWINTNVNIPEEVVKDYLDNKLIGLSDYKIVYSKKEDYGELFLVRKDEDFHYVLYNGIKQKVSLAYPR